MHIHPYTLVELGFTAHFLSQLSLEELELFLPVRVTEVQRDRLSVLGEDEQIALSIPAQQSAGDYAVGDWGLAR